VLHTTRRRARSTRGAPTLPRPKPVALVLSSAALVASMSAPAGAVAPSAPIDLQPATATAAQVDVGTATAQQIDGFGFSEAFGQVTNLQRMAASVQEAVVNLLFDPVSGAGLDIVRFGLGGAGDTSDQLWLGQQALHFGVHTFYADVWSAPAAMKTNGSQDNGGHLCGLPGEKCAHGDFRPAFARWLASAARTFAQERLPLEAIDFVNEPENAARYPSMLMTPAQAVNFVPYLGRALKAEGLGTTIACCDAEGWANSAGFAGAQAFTGALLSSPQAARYVGLIAAHGYTSPPVFPLTSQRPVWETEWSNYGPQFQAWDPAWDDTTDASGLAWANNIYLALTQADVNAFLFWWGTTTYAENGDNEGLIMLGTPSGGTTTYKPSGRLWAFAAFSRFVRPGSVRLATTTSGPGLSVAAFRDASKTVVVVINNGTSTEGAVVHLPASFSAGTVTAYLTDAHHNGTAEAPVRVNRSQFGTRIPSRAVVSFVASEP